MKRVPQENENAQDGSIVTGEVEQVSRLVLAAALGSAIGFERERLNWAAGLRTHMLVCVGATLIMLVSAFGFADVLGSQKNTVLDPSRVAAQVVSGIGFLGAGAILMRNEVVRGLTTAASLWSVAGIGLAVGGGMYTAAISATVIILLILAGVKPLERRFIAVKQQRALSLVAEAGSVTLRGVQEALGASTSRLRQFIVQRSDELPECEEIAIALSRVTGSEFDAICGRLEKLPGVRECHRGAGDRGA